MVNLSTDSAIASLSEVGDVTSLSLQDKKLKMHIPIYLIIFEEHTFYNTSCRHLDGSAQIKIVQQCDNEVSFQKTFEDIETNCSIRLDDKFLHIQMKVEKHLSGFHFGIVVPASSGITSLQEDIVHPMVNYFRSFERLYRDQQRTEYPIVTFPFNQSYLSVFLSQQYNSVFFIHEQNKETCVRITALATQTDTIDIWLHCHDEKDDILPIYSDIFSTENTPYPWQKKYKLLESRYSIQFIYESKKYLSDEFPWLQWEEPTTVEIERFFPIIEQELGRYPNDFFKEIQINRFVLISDVQCLDGKNMDGMQQGNDIFLEITESTSDFYLRRIIHHEIFHRIESQNPQIKDIISNIRPVSHLAKESASETRAEMFSMFMVNPTLLTSQHSDNKKIEHEINVIRQLTDTYDIKQTISKVPEHEHKKHIVSDINQPERYFIVGYPYSGFNLLSAIISCVSDVTIVAPSILLYIKDRNSDDINVNPLVDHYDSYFSNRRLRNKRVYGHPIEKRIDIDLLSNVYNIENSHIIWLTRHPMDICANHALDSASAESMVNQWLESNMAIEDMFGDCLFHLKYEDIVLKQNRLAELFEFMGISYSEQYRNYGDFSMPTCIKSDNEYFLGGFIDKESLHHNRKPSYLTDLWTKTWQHKIVQKSGYATQYMEE